MGASEPGEDVVDRKSVAPQPATEECPVAACRRFAPRSETVRGPIRITRVPGKRLELVGQQFVERGCASGYWQHRL